MYCERSFGNVRVMKKKWMHAIFLNGKTDRVRQSSPESPADGYLDKSVTKGITLIAHVILRARLKIANKISEA